MYTTLEENVYRLPDGTIWKGAAADLPTAQADLIGKAGKEYPTEWLKEQGALEEKKAPAKKSAKAKAQKPVENKSVKVEESKSEDK